MADDAHLDALHFVSSRGFDRAWKVARVIVNLDDGDAEEAAG
jgi:hypothetical protein